MKKKIIAILLLSLLAGFQTVFAGETCGTNVEYKIEENTISFSKGSSEEEAVWRADCGNVIRDNTGLNTVKIEDMILVEDGSHMFDRFKHIVKMDLEKLDVSRVTNMEYMFADCSALTGLKISGWDISNVKNMRGMFTGCISLTGLDLSGWDTSNVTDAEETFSGCDSLNMFIFGQNTMRVNIFESLPKYNEIWYSLGHNEGASDPLPMKSAKEEASLFESYNPNRMAGIWTTEKSAVVADSIVIRDAGGNDITGNKVTVKNAVFQLMAEVLPEGVSQDVTWSSSDASIARVSSSGKVEFIKGGTVTITASSENLITVSSSVTLYLRPAAESLSIKNKQGDDITGKKVTVNNNKYRLLASALPSDAVQTVTWKSSNKKVATVNAKGLVRFKKAGTVKITATSTDSGKAIASVKLTLGPKAEMIFITNQKGKNITRKTVTIKNTTYQLKAKALPANAVQTVKWVSGNTKIAEVDADGKVTFKKAGTVTIRAVSTDGGKKTAWIKLKLLPKAKKIVIMNPKGKVVTGKAITIKKPTFQFTAKALPITADQTVKWTSSDTSIASINKYGVLYFVQEGTVTITATSADRGKKAASVQLTYAAGKSSKGAADPGEVTETVTPEVPAGIVPENDEILTEPVSEEPVDTGMEEEILIEDGGEDEDGIPNEAEAEAPADQDEDAAEILIEEDEDPEAEAEDISPEAEEPAAAESENEEVPAETADEEPAEAEAENEVTQAAAEVEEPAAAEAGNEEVTAETADEEPADAETEDEVTPAAAEEDEPAAAEAGNEEVPAEQAGEEPADTEAEVEEIPAEQADEEPFKVAEDNYLAELINGTPSGKASDNPDNEDAAEEPVEDTQAKNMPRNEELRNVTGWIVTADPAQKNAEIINEARPEPLHTLQLFRLDR